MSSFLYYIAAALFTVAALISLAAGELIFGISAFVLAALLLFLAGQERARRRRAQRSRGVERK